MTCFWHELRGRRPCHPARLLDGASLMCMSSSVLHCAIPHSCSRIGDIAHWGPSLPCLSSLEHMCPLESAGGSRYFRPGTCRYRYHNIRNILYTLVLNFYLKFSSSKSPFCSGLAHPANHAVWHGPGPRLSELAFFSPKNRKYIHFFKICVLATFSLRRVGRPY